MFEVPLLTGAGRATTAVENELEAAAHLCQDVAVTFRMAETLSAKATLGQIWARSDCPRSTRSPRDTYHARAADECARFRDGIAGLYIDVVMGYCVAARRTLVHTLAGAPSDERQVLGDILESGCALAEIHELLEPPPAAHSDAADPCAGHLQAAYDAVHQPLERAAWAVELERVVRLSDLLSPGRSDAGEVVLECLQPVNRYAEALHFSLRRVLHNGGRRPVDRADLTITLRD